MKKLHRDYELGIITSIASGVAKGVVISNNKNEHFEITFKPEAGSSLRKYMVVGLRKDQSDFLYDWSHDD